LTQILNYIHKIVGVSLTCAQIDRQVV